MACPRLLQQSVSLCSRVCRLSAWTVRPSFNCSKPVRQQLLPGIHHVYGRREFSRTSIASADRLFSKDHEWLLSDDSKETATVGISDHAQESLGDIVFIELPDVGTKIAKSEPFGVVESVKAASDLYAMIDGRVTEVNDALAQTPELVNSDPFGAGWMIKVKVADSSQLDDLMTEDEYKTFVAESQND